MSPINSEQISRAFISKRRKEVSRLLIPNFTPRYRWWECDIFELTKSGYFIEYEIKISMTDFATDRKKERAITWYKRWPWIAKEYERKHDLLSKGHRDGPIYFTFITPRFSSPSFCIPDFAGHIIAERINGAIVFQLAKRAPRLGGRKIGRPINRLISKAIA